ncbi:hypothetical protein OU997_16210 [Pseudomonas sp. SL4(2022)]|uniref:hypothetical protein n=1 Tax=Pseudomonas sp. SL4(2022) TaxID=2994661 RepID=UPI00226F9765|nr:hypothetical protein [Pseudomonas sp. SL4(2022)]WAC43779.1 hypothetical protein OU997_16210 [Pseudomonas sp. SL4(2022)]
MRNIFIVLLVMLLAGCDVASSMKDGLKYSELSAKDLEKNIGIKPFVGFNWHNGTLTTVSVTFPSIPSSKQLEEISELVEKSVKYNFKQVPEQIVISFTIMPRTQ